MPVIERGDARGFESFGECDEGGIDDADPQRRLASYDPEGEFERLRPPAHLVSPSLEICPDTLRDTSASTALQHVVYLGEDERCSDELFALRENPVAHFVVVGLVSDCQSHNHRRVEDYRHSPKLVSFR